MLTTKEKVKAFLGISGSTHDTLLDELIKNASASIERFCNRNFTEASYTEYFSTTAGENKLFIKNYPVSTLTSVSYRSGTWGAITWEALNINDYILYEYGKIVFAFYLPDAEKYIKIVYTGGYLVDFDNEGTATHTLPADLTQICTEIVAQTFNQRTSVGISNESTEGQSITYKDSDVTKQYNSRLMSFRSINI